MAVMAALIGVASVLSGRFGFLEWDFPAGYSDELVASTIFAANIAVPARLYSEQDH